MSYNGVKPCTVCGRTLGNTPFPNKSAICRLCRKQWERDHTDRKWNKKRKVWEYVKR